MYKAGGKTSASIEKRIKECKESKKATPPPEKKPVTPQSTKTTNTPTVDGGSVAMINSINQHLSKKECDKAQTVYDTWKTYTKKTDASIEKRIKTCNDSKKVTTTDTEKKPVTPTVATTTNTSTTDAGVVINGIRWATRNVNTPGTFVANPEDAGMFYQCNRKIAWAATGDVTGWDDTEPTGTTREKANDPCPAGWRVPTYEEIKKLLDEDKVTGEWTTQNGVKGYKFTDKISGNTLFLPAVGGRSSLDGTLYYVGTSGCYWSSTQFSEAHAYLLGFNSGSADWYYGNRRGGQSVRAVAE